MPEADYKRLTGSENKMRVPAENKLMQPAENKAEAKPLKRMNKTELQAAATAVGVECNEDMTNRELMEAIEASEPHH